MVASGLLKAGETFRYQLLAFSANERMAATAPAMFNVAEVPTTMPSSGVVRHPASGAMPFGELTEEDSWSSSPKRSSRKCRAHRASWRRRDRRLLIGHLGRDASIPDIAPPDGANPARHAQGN